jgi:TetR/AcrR family transcriptional regulator
MSKARNTEQLIIDTARKIFLIEGRLHATTEDIGKAAGLPRTSVHYYFRTRDLLFKRVFTGALEDLTTRLNSVVDSSLPFDKKLDQYVETWLSHSILYPHLDTFVVTEIINQQYVPVDKSAGVRMNNFMKQIKKAMDDGILIQMQPQHFVLNLFSLLRYPSVAAPLYKQLLGISDKQYHKLLSERKSVILRSLLKKAPKPA